MTLLFECFPSIEFNVVVFGAGHVGKALVSILGAIPSRVSLDRLSRGIF